MVDRGGGETLKGRQWYEGTVKWWTVVMGDYRNARPWETQNVEKKEWAVGMEFF